MCIFLRFILVTKNNLKGGTLKTNQIFCPLKEITYKMSLKIIFFQFTKMLREIYRKGCNSKAITS